MAIMNEVFETFKQKKFKKCLELIKFSRNNEDVVENLILENCTLVCDSLTIIKENNLDKAYEMQEFHYLFFEKVASVGALSQSLPKELKLIAVFNFTFWVLLYNDYGEGLPETEEYLELLNKSLLTVLGRQVASEDICSAYDKVLNTLTCFKDYIITADYKTTLLILELVIVIIIFVANVKAVLVKDCLNVISLFIKESKHIFSSGILKDEFSEGKAEELDLFKFSLCGTTMLLSEINSEVIDCLHLLESVFQFLLEDFKGSLKSLQKNVNTGFKTFWNYLVVLNSLEVGDLNLCFEILTKMPSFAVQKNLKAKFHIIQGKLHSIKRNHKEALKEFETALTLSPNCPTIYYYSGLEYGKMGLIDLMVEKFEKLVQALQLQVSEEECKPNFETIMLNWIHPADEITENEALYALAVSLGLSERFKNAAEIFERVLQSPENRGSGWNKRIVQMPIFLTVLHEAAITNLLHGNLVRAEQIVLDAISRYIPQKSPGKSNSELTTFCKDVKWLQRIIEEELLETDFGSKELPQRNFYSEDLIFFLPENVVALLILSEIQRIQEIEDYKVTLGNVFSIFSKYLALMNKKNEIDEDEKYVLKLVKALAGKTCVKIATILAKDGDVSSVEKMYKRALSCNKGDRDALYNYYQLLLKVGKRKEAQKLWNTFSLEEVTIEIDSVQSYSLRYFLTDKITKREFENIQQEIGFKDAKLL